MVSDDEIRDSIKHANLIGAGGAGRVYAVNWDISVKLFYQSRTRTIEEDARHELRMGTELWANGVQVPKYHRIIPPNRGLPYWGLVMERIRGEEPLYTIGESRRKAEQQHREQIDLLERLGYFSFDHLPFGNNSLFNLRKAKLFLIDLTHVEKY